MMRLTRAFIPLAILCLTAGCASYGNNGLQDVEALAKIQEGATHKDEIRKLIGDPMAVTFLPAGEESWYYVYSSSTVKPATFIPVVGAFAAGANTQTTSLTLLFDKAGIVKKQGRGATTGSSGW